MFIHIDVHDIYIYTHVYIYKIIFIYTHQTQLHGATTVAISDLNDPGTALVVSVGAVVGLAQARESKAAFQTKTGENPMFWKTYPRSVASSRSYPLPGDSK